MHGLVIPRDTGPQSEGGQFFFRAALPRRPVFSTAVRVRVDAASGQRDGWCTRRTPAPRYRSSQCPRRRTRARVRRRPALPALTCPGLGCVHARPGAGCRVRRSGADDAAVRGARRRRRGRADRPGRRLRVRLLQARRHVRAHRRRTPCTTPTATWSSPACASCRRPSLRIDPAARRVETDAGTFDADVLVVALGADLHPEATPGLVEGGHEFYTVAGAFALRDVLERFDGGRVIVGVTSTPFKCPPAPSETALLMHDFLTERGLRERSEISLVMPLGRPDPAVAGGVRGAARGLRRARTSPGIRTGWSAASTPTAGWSPAHRRHRAALRPVPRRAGAPGARGGGRSRACPSTAGSRSTR